MTIYGFYVFDRHCTCVYYASFNSIPPRPGASTLPNVYRPAISVASTSVRPLTPNNAPPTSTSSAFKRDSVASTTSSSIIPPWEKRDSLQVAGLGLNSDIGLGENKVETRKGLPFDEEAKLVYGVVFSLRNMVKKLSPKDDDAFHSISTSAYKLHYLGTPTSTHFVLISSPMAESLRFVLRQIHTGPYTDYVIRNPLIELDSNISGKGIDNDAFRSAVEKILLTV